MKTTLIKQICLAVVLILAGLGCEKDGPTEYSPGGQSTPGVYPLPHIEHMNVGECQFYKVQSLIISCHEEKGFFTQVIEDQKNIIASICAKQAFATVFGVDFNPSLPAEGDTGNSWFRWWVIVGDTSLGNPPPSLHPPHPLELSYYNALNHFRNSLNAGQLNQCLGGNYPFAAGSVIIKTAFNMIELGMLDSKTFVRCYREQLELYGGQACNTAIVPQNP